MLSRVYSKESGWVKKEGGRTVIASEPWYCCPSYFRNRLLSRAPIHCVTIASLGATNNSQSSHSGMIQTGVCGAWVMNTGDVWVDMNTRAGHSPIPQMWRRRGDFTGIAPLQLSYYWVNISLQTTCIHVSRPQKCCVFREGIEWCWRSARPFKQGGIPSLTQGGSKRQALHPKQRSVIWITRMPARASSSYHLNHKRGEPRSVGKLQAQNKDYGFHWSLIEIWNKHMMRVEVPQYYGRSICLQFWSKRWDKTPKRLLCPPPIKFSHINCCQLLLVKQYNGSADMPGKALNVLSCFCNLYKNAFCS